MESIDWQNLPFDYFKTDYNIRRAFRGGIWEDEEVSQSETINIHMAATCLHYGQEAFEGLKAFRCPDGKVRLFRAEANAERLQTSSRGLVMPTVPTEMFCDMAAKVVRLNARYIPPYETGAAFYIRPLLIGMSPHLGVRPADDYLLVMFGGPIGPYYRGGFAANPYVIIRDYDRAAPLGTGRFKVGGNYAGSLLPNQWAHEQGYAGEIYLDAKEKRFIDECGAANFFGIKADTYVTPESSSILPSITNDSLMQIAADWGMKVERRPIELDELGTFSEAGACGTGAFISPIQRIDDPERGTSYTYCHDGQPGPVSTALYHHLRNIQYGIEPDTHHWTRIIEEV